MAISTAICPLSPAPPNIVCRLVCLAECQTRYLVSRHVPDCGITTPLVDNRSLWSTGDSDQQICNHDCKFVVVDLLRVIKLLCDLSHGSRWVIMCNNRIP
uniref:Uncharacterized protein n=1 Tax=Spongospora subterranea TaxID=70186 RepID=A0A0H5QQ85_9EUKA|eukprot:CRZ04198.1 hypothetical protein [Spongospora subterranea]